jgi:hypothetical protein
MEKSSVGAVALNRKIIDIAERNVSTGFDLAMSLGRGEKPPRGHELAGGLLTQTIC